MEPLRAEHGGHGNSPLLTEMLAGAVTSLVAFAYCLSFSALVFAGDLKSGIPAAFWGFMIASCAATILAGSVTSLPPLLASPRNPTVAVMSVLATTVLAAASARGLDNVEAARHVLLALSLATVVTGACCWVIGVFKLGQLVRFVPYPVVAGFIAASGWLLITGGLGVAMGRPLVQAVWGGSLATSDLPKLAVAVAFTSLLLCLRRIAGAGSLPLSIVGAAALVDAILWLGEGSQGWFLSSSGGAARWSPLALGGTIDWGLLGEASPELVSIVAVSVVALLLDVTTLEVQRQGLADMDSEFRAFGAANIAVAAVGGLTVGYSIGPSRLIEALGGKRRIAGIAAGVGLGFLLLSGVDFAQLVPRPVLGGLLVFLGIGLFGEALKSPGRRSWRELCLSLAMLAAIVLKGYLTGIILGFVGSCLLFAASYSRVGVVRRHVTRAALAAPVERAPEVLRQLSEDGRRIHILWLAGYVFFGSSNRLFEEVRRAVGARDQGRERWVVLDFGRVSGLDASAVLSFHKLVNWAHADGVELVFAAPSSGVLAEMASAGITSPNGGVKVFATRNDALEWCEDQLLGTVGPAFSPDDSASFDTWLASEIGTEAASRLVANYLERRRLDTGEVVCALGGPSDTIELIAKGSVAVMVPGLGQQAIRVRRMTSRTVVGEMGFFRGRPRAASVIAEEPAIVYVMTRAAYQRLQAEAPELCARFLELIVRALSNRVDVANREVAALV